MACISEIEKGTRRQDGLVTKTYRVEIHEIKIERNVTDTSKETKIELNLEREGGETKVNEIESEG